MSYPQIGDLHTVTIGIVGLGHLGLVQASVIARSQPAAKVICYDSRTIEHPARASEPGLVELIASCMKQMTFATDARELAECDIIYITRDITKHETEQLEPLRALIYHTADYLAAEACVVVVSQVPPGFTRGLEPIPKDRLYYQLDNLIVGEALARAARPEQMVIGCDKVGQPEFQLIHPALNRQLQLLTDRVVYVPYESAELGKMAINCFLAADIMVATHLAGMAALCPPADWAEVQDILRGDSRIGRYTSAGLGIGGGHLMRDVEGAQVLQWAQGTKESLFSSIYLSSITARDWVGRKLHDLAVPTSGSDAVVCVLGLAYKVGTDSTVDSPGVRLIKSRPYTYRVHDPRVQDLPGIMVHHAKTPMAAAQGAAALVITTPWPEYAKLDLAALKTAMRGNILIDPFRVLNRTRAERAGFAYHTLGAS